MEIQNSLTKLLPGLATVFGTITAAAPASGTPVLSNLTGTVDFDQVAVSVTRTAIGNYALSITNFNPQGAGGGTSTCLGFGTCSTTGATISTVVPIAVWTEPATYSGDTATINFHTVITSTGLAQDTQFNFLAVAY